MRPGGLNQGGIIPKPQLIMLGDGKPELVVPLKGKRGLRGA